MRKESVLVVDDNDMMRNTLEMFLRDRGFSVTCCPDGTAALEAAKENHFDAYLIDYRMPEMNGAVVTALLREIHSNAFIIGFSIESREREFLAAGADRFLSKDTLNNELMPLII